MFPPHLEYVGHSLRQVVLAFVEADEVLLFAAVRVRILFGGFMKEGEERGVLRAFTEGDEGGGAEEAAVVREGVGGGEGKGEGGVFVRLETMQKNSQVHCIRYVYYQTTSLASSIHRPLSHPF